MIDLSFFGVYNRKGELEAVESSALGAMDAALALSPMVGNARQLNRTVEPIIVIRGHEFPIDEAMIDSVKERVKARVNAANFEMHQEIGKAFVRK